MWQLISYVGDTLTNFGTPDKTGYNNLLITIYGYNNLPTIKYNATRKCFT